MTKCTLCGSKKNTQFDEHYINNRYFDFTICMNCSLIRCEEEFLVSQKSHINQQRCEYTVPSIEVIEATYKPMIFELIKEFDVKARGALLDFGCGNGGIAMASCSIFEKVYGLELDTSHFLRNNTNSMFNNFSPVETLEDLNTKVDVVVFWHVLEHISNFDEIVEYVKPHLSDNFSILAQIPLYREKHVFESHIHFFSKTSLKFFAKKFSAKNVRILIDHTNDFATLYFEGCRN